jgi:hypothetical protein
MTLKEYEVQLGLGTVDFRFAAVNTQSSTVLQDIIGRTDDIAVLYAVATNPNANIYTLTLLATFPYADEGVIISCAYHPNVNLNILERWMKYPTIKCIQAVQRRVRAFQLAAGISEKDALPIEEIAKSLPDPWKILIDDINTIRQYPPTTQTDYTIWTTTGSNGTIELDEGKFKFVNDDDKVYYSYDKGISYSMKWASK